MWTVYILKSVQKETYYIGCTNNLERRLSEHNKGYTPILRKNIPYVVIYTEEYKVREEAFAREKNIKSFKGGNAFKNLIKK